MNLPQNPAEAQAALLKRSKELDAQEEYLQAIRTELDNGPMTIKVFGAQVGAKKEQLEELEQEIAQATESLGLDRKLITEEIQKLETVRDDSKGKYTELTTLISEESKKLRELQAESRKVVGETATRRDYLQTQELQIEEAIAEGNATLLSLNEQVQRLKTEIQSLASDKLDLQTQVDDFILRVSDLEDNYNTTLDALQLKKEQMENQIDITHKQLIEETSRYKEIGIEVNKKLDILREKEESIIVKQDALRLDRQQLNHDKMRWENSKRALYGDNV